jgi:7,8-dihydro-6-hydroxymethylpterin-pyrophosphokinase (HPPK)
MNRLVISIGSNSRDREWQMKNGLEWLRSVLSHIKESEVYNSAASNGRDADYLNAVVSASCRESLDDITAKFKEYENVCGRTPASKQTGEIPMDIDIIIWNDEIIRPNDYEHEYFKIGWNMIH